VGGKNPRRGSGRGAAPSQLDVYRARAAEKLSEQTRSFVRVVKAPYIYFSFFNLRFSFRVCCAVVCFSFLALSFLPPLSPITFAPLNVNLLTAPGLSLMGLLEAECHYSQG